jgi:hypothetical protein
MSPCLTPRAIPGLILLFQATACFFNPPPAPMSTVGASDASQSDGQPSDTDSTTSPVDPTGTTSTSSTSATGSTSVPGSASITSSTSSTDSFTTSTTSTDSTTSTGPATSTTDTTTDGTTTDDTTSGTTDPGTTEPGTTGMGDGFYGPCTNNMCPVGSTCVSLEGLDGTYCAPMCDSMACPAASGGAMGQCVIIEAMGQDPTLCAAICMVGQNNCPAGTTCKDIMMGGFGLCTAP